MQKLRNGGDSAARSGPLEPPTSTAAAPHSPQGCGLTFRKRGEQPIELAAAQVSLALGRELADDAANNAADDLARRVVRAIADAVTMLLDCAAPLVLGRPSERVVRLDEIGRRSGDRACVEPVRFAQRTPDAHPFEPLVLVARVLRRRHCGGCADRLELEPAPAEKRTYEPDMGARRDRPRPHRRQPPYARPAR